jgi:serine protease Do
MMTIRLFLHRVLLCLLTVTAVEAGEATSGTPLPMVIPPVAKVMTYLEPGKSVVTESQGFVVESSGFLLTTYSTLLRPNTGNLLDEIEVDFPGEKATRYSAMIVAVEPTLNIAILKIGADRTFPAARIIDRERIRSESAIYAVSGFDGSEPVLTKGELKRLNVKECYQASMTSTMLVADISIPDGVLGGPVFNREGEVIGMNTGYTEREAMINELQMEEDESAKGTHILPIFLAFNIYESLKYRKSLKSPWTGFSVRPLTSEEESIFPRDRVRGGIGIEYVWPNSPAAKLGIKQNDILVRFSYYPTTSPAEFQKWLYMYGVGGKVKLHIIRDRKDYLTFDYVIEERPAWAKPH